MAGLHSRVARVPVWHDRGRSKARKRFEGFPFPETPRHGGANRNRTDDLLNAIQALSQLSYGPAVLR